MFRKVMFIILWFFTVTFGLSVVTGFFMGIQLFLLDTSAMSDASYESMVTLSGRLWSIIPLMWGALTVWCGTLGKLPMTESA